ncbi:Imm1 family immunity protein [Roseimicrobium sp. ORNL1]|uniref:Imm1 family immunity protein n=1 Tax=Roseimicrobium sp. ORNL1 TaxID=2711231 RepID=UPI0013E18B0F|nr:Imm1 family immunity protein [Roseimicrobium sp. ORNL1]QIF05608.1 hypothetical protein G5S37_30285 [Roseimicrobium sp. ORNL1]
MQETETGMWILEVDESPTIFPSKQELIPALAAALQSRSRGRVDISEDYGKRSWWGRFLSMAPRMIQMHVAIEWCNGCAALIFFDDAVNEHRAMDREQPVLVDAQVRRQISHGEQTPAAEDECMSLPRAQQAITEYLQTGERPPWLQYRVVR